MVCSVPHLCQFIPIQGCYMLLKNERIKNNYSNMILSLKTKENLTPSCSNQSFFFSFFFFLFFYLFHLNNLNMSVQGFEIEL